MLEKSESLSAGSAVAVRISRNGEAAIFKTDDDHYQMIHLSTGDPISSPVGTLAMLVRMGSWRMPTRADEALVASLFNTPSDITIVEAETSVKPYRVPAAVKDEIANALDFYTKEFSDTDREIASMLANNETVGLREVSWVNQFFCDHQPEEQLRGGYKGKVWASKIVSSEDGGSLDKDPYAKYDFNDEDGLAYYGLGPDEESIEANELIAVDVASGSVLRWTAAGFVDDPEIRAEDIEAPLVMPIDRTTAEVLARWIDEDPSTARDLRDTDPDERNIFDMAESELDFESMERMFAVIADASGYTPAERSINARRQIRGQGGKFGGRQVKQGTKLLAFKKGKLADKLPLVLNPGQIIQAWIAAGGAPVTAAAGDSQSIGQPSPDPMPPTQSGGQNTMEDPNQQTPAQPEGEALYFAIVDAADTTAVLEMIAISKGKDGNPQAWIRKRGTWTNDPATLTKLTGATPPPVVQLNSPEPAKTVIAQVDDSDANLTKFPTDAVPTEEPTPPPVTASGFITSDASVQVFGVEDIIETVSSFDSLSIDTQREAKRLLRRRARALNRMDLLPEAWRTASAVEQGEELASASPLFGQHGQVLVAAGKKKGGNANNLQSYWIHGAGAAKVRWGTPGDLTRAHRHLAKYVDPNRAWGLAQSYHKALFGVPNITHDRATGQYRGRK